MDKVSFIETLEGVEQLQLHKIKRLKALIDEYPYFQSARALYLKGLKNRGSFKYNNELKITASYTVDRAVLFEFITSKVFNTNIYEEKTDKKEADYKEKTDEKVTKAKEKLKVGLPLIFSKNETHSFSQWLQLSAKKPISRELNLTQKEVEKDDERVVKDNIIEQFIANNPKISRLNKAISSEVKIEEPNEVPQLMTETLAKVYLEQKKYGNAIKAYEILSLKYPEKSSFFANQIKQVRILQNNK